MRILWAFMTIVGLAACQGGGYGSTKTLGNDQSTPTQAEVAKSSVKGSTEVVDRSIELMFLDLSNFDDELSDSLRTRSRDVVVKIPAKFSLNDIPERLDIWFSRIKESGGRVQAVPKAKEGEDQTRSLGLLINIAVSAYTMASEEWIYSPADDYNVILKYDAETGEVENATFYHR